MYVYTHTLYNIHTKLEIYISLKLKGKFKCRIKATVKTVINLVPLKTVPQFL